MMVAVVSAARDIVGVLWLGGAPNLRLSTARVPCRACGSDARQRLSTMQRSLHLGKRMPAASTLLRRACLVVSIALSCGAAFAAQPAAAPARSEEHTSELQSLMRISYAVFCLKKTKKPKHTLHTPYNKRQTNPVSGHAKSQKTK